MPTEPIPIEHPLVPLACALGAGIALGYAWPAYRMAAGFAAAGCLVWVAMGIFHRRPALAAPLLVFFFLGYLLIQPWAAPRFRPDAIIHNAGKGRCQIVGQVHTAPVVAGFRQKFLLSVLFIIRHHHRYRATGRLHVTFADDFPALSKNERVRIRGDVRRLHNFNNPGGFNYKHYMAAQGVWASIYVPKGALKVLKVPKGQWHPMDRVRDRIARFLEQRAGADTLGVFKTLLLGDRRDLSAETRQAFQRAGIGHLLAISGLHVGIVGGVLFFLATGLLSLLPYLLWRGWVRPAAAVLATIGVWAYGLLAGMSPSTQRAVLMMSIFFLSFFSGRSPALFNTLAAAAMGILVFHPPALAGVSFQLSFSAVAVIVLGLRACDGGQCAKEGGFWTGWRRKLTGACLVSLWATLGTLPLVMHYFHRVSLVGLPCNLLFVPLIGFCVLPLALSAVCLLPVSRFLAAAVLWPADRLLSLCLMLVKKIAAYPFSSIMTIIPSGFEIMGYYAVLMLVVGYLGGRRGRGDTSGFPKVGFGRNLWRWAGALCLLLVLLDVGYWGWRRFWCGQLRVTVVDVGNGSANILELPGGKTLLIDGGGFPDNAVFDVGKNIVAPLLLRDKILSIEEIILSHPDSDHLNGLIYIVKHFRVNRLRTNGDPANTKAYHAFMRIVRQRHIRVLDDGVVPGWERMNGVLLKFLYPPADYRRRMKIEPWRRKANNDSLVVQVRFGERVFLFPGDIEQEAEAELVHIAGDALRSDVLVAPHHGSATSGTMVFLKKVAPRIVVFSTAEIYGRQRPGRKAKARYDAVCKRLYSTYINGAVMFSTDGHCLSRQVMIEKSLPEGR